MTHKTLLYRAFVKSGIYTLLLSICFVVFSLKDNSSASILVAIPFFIILYFTFFSLGKPVISNFLREKMQGNVKYIVPFPLLLSGLYFTYIVINGDNPLQGTSFLLPYLLFFPVLMLSVKNNSSPAINWIDFFTFFMFFFPVTLVKINFNGDLPYNTGGFDSVYRICVMLTAIYAFVTIRNLKDAGCYPTFNWKFLFTTLWVWMVFYISVFAIGYGIDFIKLSSNHHYDLAKFEKIATRFISIFLHTALFEELVFRGLLQNMLSKRIGQSATWQKGWYWGLGILIALAILVGFSMKGSMHWFPALITGLLFAAAYGLEKMKGTKDGGYTALAITSVIFGLVHFHSGSIIFTGLACIGGWAYGYVYLKTKNVFYCALLHALVNSTPLMLGLELAK